MENGGGISQGRPHADDEHEVVQQQPLDEPKNEPLGERQELGLCEHSRGVEHAGRRVPEEREGG